MERSESTFLHLVSKRKINKTENEKQNQNQMSQGNGIGSHQSRRMKNDEWITPKFIIDQLGRFDLDPCSPIVPPYKIADKTFNVKDDGMCQDWFGRVWLNPPYGNEASKWLDKLSDHGNGIALIFARTETKMFFEHVWNKAHSLLFIEGRLYFHYVDGTRSKVNSGAPSVLIAYGQKCSIDLMSCGINGKYINLK